MNHDVFISYSSRNKPTALALCHVLEEHRIKCWIAPRDIPPGADYGDVIDEAIVACRLFVLVFSAPASISQWVKGELNLAFSEKKIIIPYRIDETPLKGAMRLILNQTHWVDAYPDAESKFGELVEAAERFLGRPADSAAAVAPAVSAASAPSAAPARTDAAAVSVVPLAGVSSAESVRSETPVGGTVQSATPVAEEQTAVRRYEVGDYYDVDGKRGIVFEVDASGLHGKIVGMKGSIDSKEMLRWCAWEVFYRGIETGATNERDGISNQQTIERIAGWREKYPAFAWCAAQGEGWYLPSVGELEKLLLDDAVRKAVNRALRQNKGSGLSSDCYWSSTETDKQNAKILRVFYSGKRKWEKDKEDNREKQIHGYVRAVAAF